MFGIVSKETSITQKKRALNLYEDNTTIPTERVSYLFCKRNLVMWRAQIQSTNRNVGSQD